MEPKARPTPNEPTQLASAKGLALVRVTIGVEFVWLGGGDDPQRCPGWIPLG